MSKKYHLIPPIAGASGEPPAPPAPATPPATPPGGDNSSTPPETTPAPVPYERFKEVNESLSALKKQLKALEDAKATTDEQRQKDEEERAKAQGEWQKLAETNEAKAEKHKEAAATFKAENERLRAVVTGIVTERVKELPEELKALDPGGDDLVARLEWLNKTAAVAAKLKGTPPLAGNPRAPVPTGRTDQGGEAARKEQAAYTWSRF